jgi:hypothetical protein
MREVTDGSSKNILSLAASSWYVAFEWDGGEILPAADEKTGPASEEAESPRETRPLTSLLGVLEVDILATR